MNKKIFRGWWVLLGLFIVYGASNGIVTLSLKRFYPSLIEAFGWGPDQVTQPVSVFYFALAVLMPILGALLDRKNPKRIMLGGAIIILVGLALFSQIQSLGHFIGVYVILAIGLAGAGLASSMYILTKWFYKQRGLAVGMLLVGGSLGGAVFNKVAGDAIDAMGWQDAALLLLGIGAVCMILPIFTLIQESPEKVGLHMDGGTEAPKTAIRKGLTLTEAFRTPTLYLIFLTTGILWFCIIGMGQHQDIYLQNELKLDSSLVTNVGSSFFLFGVLGKIFFGFLSDRFNKKWVMVASIFLLLIGNGFLFLMGIDPGNWSPYWYAVTYGIAFSGVFTMIQVVVAEIYYGQAYGKILGAVLTIDTLASVAGIVFLGKMSAANGSYIPGIKIMAGLCLLAILGILLIRTNFKTPAIPST